MNVVGEVYKPAPEVLVEMYETFQRQGAEITRQFRDGTLIPAHVQALIEHRNPFASEVSPARINHAQLVVSKPCSERTGVEQLVEWIALYAELGITLTSEEVTIPAHQEGLDRLIVVPKGMMPQKAFDLCTVRFNGKTWKYVSQSLDKAVPTNDRTAESGSYAIWIRDRVEADEELKNLSADMLTEQSVKGITLLERLLYEIKYHAETGKHLDLKNWTLCSGSRVSDGYVPSVYWNDGKLWVLWHYVSSRFGNLRSRAVSL
ncbi:MAG: Uncharacterized protein G01um101472_293 [Parcubacteria group bacterium Gr01-1014_72]|nr:MAG: Uncharacterized protein G01um101472_293 [Parcubacteria group bacterium Gr01-1014_72]